MLRLRRVLGAVLLAIAFAPSASAGNFDWIGHVELDAENLKSEDPSARLNAVLALSGYDPALAKPYLLQALEDDEDAVKLEAGRALGHGGVTEAAPTIIDWLNDFDPKVRAAAADILGELGGEGVSDALIRSLGDTDATVRVRAVGALGKLGKAGDLSVVVPLVSRLDDDKTDVRRSAIEQLEAIGDRRAVIPLVAAIGDTSVEVRKAAVRALGTLGDDAAVPALLRLLDDPVEDVRKLSVEALGSLHADEATEELIERLGSGSDEYRAKVALALGRIAANGGGGQAATDAVRSLVEALAVPNQRAGAREALRVAGLAAVPALVDHLDGRIDGDPREVVALLREAADRRATASLIAELDRGRVPTTVILEALAATNDPDAVVPILGLTGSDDAELRLASMTALRPLLGGDARAADVLIERLDDEDLEVRVMAVEYLGLLRSQAAAERLADLAGPGNPLRLRLAAIDAVGEIGDPAAATMLVDVLREGPPALHGAAATALSYLGGLDVVDELLEMVKADRSASRHPVVRALGAVLRGQAGTKQGDRARRLFEDLADAGASAIAMAAIGGLAALDDAAAAPALLDLLSAGGPDRQRASAWALGELHHVAAVPALVEALDNKDDRVTADVAWALGEIAASSSDARKTVADAALPALARAGKKGGWATAINVAAALTRIADPSSLEDLLRMIHHKSKLVRVDAILGLGALIANGATIASVDRASLINLLETDASPYVRAAAATTLTRLRGAEGGDPVTVALAHAASSDRDDQVRAAAAATTPAAAPPRDEWRVFYVVDPSADDKAVREEPYFVIGADALVWATYTDARGELAAEHFPAGDAVVAPQSRESEY